MLDDKGNTAVYLLYALTRIRYVQLKPLLYVSLMYICNHLFAIVMI